MSDESQGDGWWLASDGKWYPPGSKAAPLPPPTHPGPADVTPVAQHDWRKVTPNIWITPAHISVYGSVRPLGGVEWQTTTSGSTTRVIPPWAVVMCILTIWICGLGLFFLAVKQEKYHGEVSVSARTADGRTWTDTVTVASFTERDAAIDAVNWAQSVTASAD